MENKKIIKVKAIVIDAKHDISSNCVIVRLDVNGERRAVEISPQAIILFDADRETSFSIMKSYAEAWKNRKIPLNLELTEAQLRGEEDIAL